MKTHCKKLNCYKGSLDITSKKLQTHEKFERVLQKNNSFETHNKAYTILPKMKMIVKFGFLHGISKFFKSKEAINNVL